MFKLEIDTGNAAFHDSYTGEADELTEAAEIMRILATVQEKLNLGYREGACFDYNGNMVGQWSLE